VATHPPLAKVKKRAANMSIRTNPEQTFRSRSLERTKRWRAKGKVRTRYAATYTGCPIVADILGLPPAAPPNLRKVGFSWLKTEPERGFEFLRNSTTP